MNVWSKLIPPIALALLVATGTAWSALVSPFSEAARLYVDRIDAHPPTGDVDKDFADFLVPQHLSGVELSKVQIGSGHDATLLAIANDILAHADRNDPVTSNVPPLPAKHPRRAQALEAITAADTQARRAFEASPEGDVDQQFAHLMGSHHQRAIDYASAELRLGRDPHLLQMAQAILQGQQDQHEQMMQRLSDHNKPKH